MRAGGWGISCVLIIAAFMMVKAEGGRPPESKIDGFAFLTGSWRREAGNTVMEERWMPPAGGCMMGMMRQVTGGKTTVREFILLEEAEEGIRMTVKHVGPMMEDVLGRTMHLKLARFDGKEAVFENAGPESLKAVTYRKENDGSLYAAIKVERNGQTRDIELPFSRAEGK